MSRSKVYTNFSVKEDIVIKQEIDNSKDSEILLHETSTIQEPPDKHDVKSEEETSGSYFSLISIFHLL